MKNKGNPGKKYMTREEYFHYVDLMNAKNDIETIKLGIALFKSSTTFKHYRYSPAYDRFGRKCKLIVLLKDFEEIVDNTKYSRALLMLDVISPELKKWMLRHTL